ncbi:MAG: DUF2975 domain-containing protein [Micrococcales bacterium]|nr:DUF2975 domain-containing protein [Micrococcales bacterium]
MDVFAIVGSLVWIVAGLLVLAVLAVVVYGAWRVRSTRGIGIVVEGAALLFLAVAFVGFVVAPLVRMANRTYVESRCEGHLVWQVDDLPVTLNDAGIAAVYEPGRTEADGWAQVHNVYISEPHTTALVKFQQPGWVDFMATTGSTVLGGLVFTAAVFFLWRVARTIRGDEPFAPANAKRLYAAALLFLVGGAWSWVSVAIALVAMGDLADYVDSAVELPADQILLGLVVGMLAVVFQRGITLRRDTEGLV